jgi:exopolysaccharide biosynthesis polyprenyl glycosylphosphotransferase
MTTASARRLIRHAAHPGVPLHPGPRPRSRRRPRGRAAVLRRLLVTADIIGGALGAASGALVAAGEDPKLIIATFAITLLWPILTWSCGLLRIADLSAWASGISDSGRLLLAAMILSWLSFVAFALADAVNPAPGAATVAIATGIATTLLRAAARVGAHRRPNLRQRTLILGSGEVADRLAGRLRTHDELSLQLVGVVDDQPIGENLVGLPRLGGFRDLRGVLDQHGVDRVMFAFTRSGHDEMLAALRTCRTAGVAVDVVPRLFDFLDGARTLDQIGGMPLLSIDSPSLARSSRIAKRTLDIVGAALGLIVLSPVLLLAALAIRLETPGPVLFRQVRVGRRGRHFTLYKFRSMRVGSTVLVRDDGAIVKGERDPRVTRVGALLRRTSLDEIPQLVNVLKGDMSLVGPRPLVLAEAQALTEEWQQRRADLRPGLTGSWQVAGRSNIPFHEMIRFDFQYVANWSLGRDVAILLATLPAVFSGRGAC